MDNADQIIKDAYLNIVEQMIIGAHQEAADIQAKINRFRLEMVKKAVEIEIAQLHKYGAAKSKLEQEIYEYAAAIDRAKKELQQAESRIRDLQKVESSAGGIDSLIAYKEQFADPPFEYKINISR